MIPNKELRQLARKLKKQGWTVTATKGGHLTWTSPGGRRRITGSTPNNSGLRNALAELRRVEKLEAVR